MKKKTHAAFCCVSPDMLVGNGSGLEVLGHFLDFSIDVVDELAIIIARGKVVFVVFCCLCCLFFLYP